MNELMTVPEVAARLRKTEAFVRDQLRKGKLRGSSFGSAWHVTEADLLAYIEAHANVRPVEKRRRSA